VVELITEEKVMKNNKFGVFALLATFQIVYR
jgi:hypothetical protein